MNTNIASGHAYVGTQTSCTCSHSIPAIGQWVKGTGIHGGWFYGRLVATTATTARIETPIRWNDGLHVDGRATLELDLDSVQVVDPALVPWLQKLRD